MIVLENEKLKIGLEPALGGKIVSFFHKGKGFELAAQRSGSLEELPSPGDSFAPYAFGMDDAFPNIDGEKIDWQGRELFYPDHGEIWSAAFEVIEVSRDRVSLKWISGRFGYRYQKLLHLDGDTLQLCCRITNESGAELPCFWTWHGLVRYEEDMRVLWPSGTSGFLNVQANGFLGRAGARYDVQNSKYDFTRVPGIKPASTAKYYVEHPVSQGCCGLHYPSQGVTLTMEYDSELLPYLGFWVTAGGFQGDYNCALEPTNGFYDSISAARENGKLPRLQPGESMALELKLMLKCDKIR